MAAFFFFSPLSFLMILLLLPLCSYYCYLYSSIMPSALHTHTHTHTHTRNQPHDIVATLMVIIRSRGELGGPLFELRRGSQCL